MVKFENFAIYKPEFKSAEEDEPEYRPDILYARDKNGRDWYDCQADFSSDTLKVMYDENGIIVCISKDATAIFPPGFSVAEVAISETPPEACNDMTWVYRGGRVIKRIYSPAEKRKMVQGRKSVVLRVLTRLRKPSIVSCYWVWLQMKRKPSCGHGWTTLTRSRRSAMTQTLKNRVASCARGTMIKAGDYPAH